MISLNRPARLNRTLLAVFGVLLLGSGTFALTGHFGQLTFLDSGATLIPTADDPPTWALWVTAATAVAVGLLILRWLVAQLSRRPKTHTWHLEQNPEQGHTALAASTATAPFLSEITTYPGIHSARATLAGTRQNPALAIAISTEQDGDLSTINHRLNTHGLPRLRQALDLDTLPVTVEYRFTTHTGTRAR
ncbi:MULTISPECIES: hypothetical protein [unclassified Streptomyces]|uniref:hypothetical protein n=1 Tax=unclassified Streptomyces TaxID=2593676 RepID=UPI002DD7FE90|nr:hypothetical protein [Streptomyces sp. NBC_01750]WSA98589.1 alkaline shock response membrane anchor protein AmaP [Streptomyces sp. NBC_01794]WSD36876.1 alkaline shock response membrane anchor protein AmaP [Streptomyces sp. NBC_01750]